MSSPPGLDLAPRTLPIFPLTGFLLLPGAHAPLHIFEPRYRRLVADALADSPYLGMIQPREPRDDDRGPPPESLDEEPPPELYEIGCAAHLSVAERFADGRYLVLLRGLHRFRVVRELPLLHGYRRVIAASDEFAADLDAAPEIDAAPLLAALAGFCERHGVELEMERLSKLPGHSLLTSMAMALPFAAAEKQALLEAVDIGERRDVLLTLLAMGVDLENEAPRPS